MRARMHAYIMHVCMCAAACSSVQQRAYLDTRAHYVACSRSGSAGKEQRATRARRVHRAHTTDRHRERATTMIKQEREGDDEKKKETD